MMLQSFAALTRTDLAFRSDHLLTVRLELPQDRYSTPAARARFGEALRERTAAIPGVSRDPVGTEHVLAFDVDQLRRADRSRRGRQRARDAVAAQHEPGRAARSRHRPDSRPRFRRLRTLDTPPVAILSEASARQLWPGQDPIGRQFRTGSRTTASTVTVVGVAADAGIAADSVSAKAHPHTSRSWMSTSPTHSGRTAADARRADDRSAVRRDKDVAAAIAAIDAALPAYDIAPLDDRLRLEERSVGFASLLLNLYGGLALLLAAIGVYGVLAATVASRVRELGIRAALGAAPHRLQLAIVRQGLVVTLSAIAAGVVVTAALASSTRAIFFEASAADPRSLGGAAALLAVVAIAASFIPARRASRIDPVRVLKID